MANFEQVGRKIDRELERLREFFETELKPTTKRKAAEASRKAAAALRMASKGLAEAAKDLEARVARMKK